MTKEKIEHWGLLFGCELRGERCRNDGFSSARNGFDPERSSVRVVPFSVLIHLGYPSPCTGEMRCAMFAIFACRRGVIRGCEPCLDFDNFLGWQRQDTFLIEVLDV